ncbi:unnamed protein product [Danaus chrysippus]|uniref:(African queen) hypothetical protein n=1 Tax=Danaus chrysippus TaxID=151541 RepID=A0A8J2QR81_9NEOP|nr:unnamed protein product [Danaus chrysippus]
MHEPRLLSTEPSHYILEPQQPYHYRFRAVDDVKTLEEEIAHQDPNLRRHPRESLRAFLLSSLAVPLDGRGQKLVHQFCVSTSPPDTIRARLLKSVSCVSSVRSSPQRRPARLLDPARLRTAHRPNNHYTALENMPVEAKLQDEVLRVPVKTPPEPLTKPPADETAL